MPEEVFTADPGPFADVPSRHTTDYFLLGLQQEMVQLTGQADLKGSIVITAASIVVSVSATQFSDPDLRWSLVTLVAFSLLALLSSILAVFPKFKIHRPGDQLPDGFNPFFFGHCRSKERHREVMADKPATSTRRTGPWSKTSTTRACTCSRAVPVPPPGYAASSSVSWRLRRS
jgi:hypothetical protein